MLRNFQKAVAWSLWHHMMVAMPTISPVNRFKPVFMSWNWPRKYDFITIADWYQVAIENPNIWVGTDSVHFNMETNGGELYAQTVKEALDKAEKGPVKK